MLRAMQVGVRASLVVKGRRRFIDWVIEVDTVRSWRDLRAFRDIDQCRAFLVALPPGITSSWSPPDLCAAAPNRSTIHLTAIPDAAGWRGSPRTAPLSLRPVRYAGDPALCAHI